MNKTKSLIERTFGLIYEYYALIRKIEKQNFTYIKQLRNTRTHRPTISRGGGQY